MISIRPFPKHCCQERHYSCGAASFAMIFNVDEATARTVCKTDAKGTADLDVFRAIRDNTSVIPHHIVIRKDYRELFWLETLCQRFPLYLSCTFISQGKKGRPNNRHHAVVASRGMILDPSEVRECPLSAFTHTFNKSLIINAMIVLDYELPGWKERITQG